MTAVIYFSVGKTTFFRYDFKNICVAAGKINLTKFNPAEKAAEITETITQLRTREASNVFNAAFMVRPSERYDIVLRGARELGLNDWNCEDLRIFFK